MSVCGRYVMLFNRQLSHSPCLKLATNFQRYQRNGLPSRPLISATSTMYNSTEIVTKEPVFLNTNHLVNALEENGFSRQQAECLTSVLLAAFSKTAEITSKESVSKEKLEITVQNIMAHLSAIKKDMIILERSEFSALRAENDRLEIQVKQLTKQLQDEITNLTNKVALDINLEKSRTKEEAYTHKIQIEANKNLITTEVAKIMSKLEQTKNDIFRYFAGTILACLTMGLGFYRIWAR